MESGHKTKYRAEIRLMTVVGLLLMTTGSAMAQTVSPESRAAVGNTLPITKAGKPTDAPERSEIELLKAQVEAQHDELIALRKALEEQTRLIERVLQSNAGSVSRPAGGTVNTAAADAKQLDGSAAAPLATSGASAADPAARNPQPIAVQDEPSPLRFRIGSTSITPFGQFDLTAVIRGKNVGSGVSTSFGAVPFNNTVSGHLREYQISGQNTRMGLRVDAQVKGIDLLGYLETDFQGFAPSNIAVTSHSDSLRLRLGFVDVRKNKFEMMAGQAFSMLTPNRKGLSAVPADVFTGRGVDSALHLGLSWTRTPQFRLIYHANKAVTLGISVEASEQYGGGSAGSGAITLPSALASAYGPQLNTGSGTFNVPNPNQDNIGKIAFDSTIGNREYHFEVAGLLRRFAFYNPLSDQNFSKFGGGVSVNGNIELFKNFRLAANTFYSNGGGRYIFGQGPDLIIRGDGSPQLVRSYSTMDGFEYQATPQTMIYAYYGGAYFERASTIDPANGNQVGFGYTGSPQNHNRSIQQGTFGLNHTFWRDPNYGSMQFMSQYSYLTRNRWFVDTGEPGSAHLNMLFLTFRYVLPGSPPTK